MTKALSTGRAAANRIAAMKNALPNVTAAAVVLIATLTAAPASALTTVAWTGAGTTAHWSDAGNWDLGRPPGSGEIALFGGSPSFANSTVDLSVALHSLVFAANAQAFAIHVSGDAGSTLAFDTLGVQNLTGTGGPIRQGLFADAGTTGGMLLFANGSGLNLGAPGLFRPVDLTARGGATAGALGGHIVFQDNASTGTTTFNALRAEGASVAGATGGEIVFRGNAVATIFTTVVANGGSGPSAAGGSVSFTGGARVDGTVAALAGEAGGAGGRVTFAGNAVASATSSLSNFGGSAFGVGSEGVTYFRGDSRLAGTVSNYAGSDTGFAGGLLEFHDLAAFDSTVAAPGFGTIQIVNTGSIADSAGPGRTIFHDDSFARGAGLVITNNANGEGATVGSFGGTTDFFDRSHAGQLTIFNEGASVATAAGAPVTESGRTGFRNASSAENAQITSNGGGVAGAAGGRLQFFDDATAAGARIDNLGGRVAGAFGGSASFDGRASAGNATIVNAFGESAGASGGATSFAGNSSAGNAYISNQARLSTSGGQGGTTRFADFASAGRATIDNQGGIDGPDRGRTDFAGNANAGNALLTNLGGRGDGSGFINGGVTFFQGASSAGAATIINAGGNVAGAYGGSTNFSGTSTAANATISVFGSAAPGAHGGYVSFFAQSSAGDARITVDGASFASAGAHNGGQLYFDSLSSAGNAVIVIGGGRVANAQGGDALFFDGQSGPGQTGPTAARASITVAAGAVENARGGTLGFGGLDTSAGNARIVNQGGSASAYGGTTTFGGVASNGATAGNASITNQGGSASGGSTAFIGGVTAANATIVNLGGTGNGNGGTTTFMLDASAGNASITNVAGIGFGDGYTRFSDNSTAASATIVAQGSTAATAGSGRGAYVLFTDTSTAGSATLVAEGASSNVAGNAGGILQFVDMATAGSARVVLQESGVGGRAGTMDISGSARTDMSVGSIEGGGTLSLGSKLLYVGANAQDATFSGSIRDGGSFGGTGGGLWIYGAGSLTLTGANTYTGVTHVGSSVGGPSGKLIVANTTGSATGSGAVIVEQSGTLSGSGFIDGPVILRAGATIAPGDPVTLTLRDSLTWDGGGTIRLVLGADDAGSDHVHVGSLIRGADGEYLFDLVDWGIVAGQEYDLLSFDSLVGFSAGDFSVRGVAGEFNFDGGTLGFTAASGPVAAVPEPSTVLLMAGGLIAIWSSRRSQRRRQAASAR